MWIILFRFPFYLSCWYMYRIIAIIAQFNLSFPLYMYISRKIDPSKVLKSFSLYMSKNACRADYFPFSIFPLILYITVSSHVSEFMFYQLAMYSVHIKLRKILKHIWWHHWPAKGRKNTNQIVKLLHAAFWVKSPQFGCLNSEDGSSNKTRFSLRLYGL